MFGHVCMQKLSWHDQEVCSQVPGVPYDLILEIAVKPSRHIPQEDSKKTIRKSVLEIKICA